MHYTLIAGEQETLGSQCGTAMSATSLRPNIGGIIAAVEVDSFGLVFSPAKPTLDMIRTMRPCLKWCDMNRTREGILPLNTRKEFWQKNQARARFAFDLIPDQNEVLAKAQGLFDAAEH